MTLIPSLTFTDYEWFPWSICNGCCMPAGNAYPSGHLVPSPVVGLACALIVETRFLELAMFLLDFSPRIPLDTFSILLHSIIKDNSNFSEIAFREKIIPTVHTMETQTYIAIKYLTIKLLTSHRTKIRDNDWIRTVTW